jgi:hypothetical protein
MTVMQVIRSLNLPETLPTDECMKSYGHNKYTYNPEFWEFEYEVNRYLEHIHNGDLITRYYEIAKNIALIVSDERNQIPINTFLSSWFWYRKEHQTRYEIYKRHLTIDQNRTFKYKPKCSSIYPRRPNHPNSCDILYRYMQRKYAIELVSQGKLRLSPASFYQKSEMSAARYDNEVQKSHSSNGKYITITTENGQNIPIKGNLKRTVSIPNYYMYCMSCDFNTYLMSEFGDEDPTCIVINNPQELSRIIERKVQNCFPDWKFFECPINYYDLFELMNNQRIDAGMSKDFKYAYQREYRYILFPKNGDIVNDYNTLDLGPLTHILELL